MDSSRFERYRPAATAHGLPLESYILGARLIKRVGIRDLPLLTPADDRPHWMSLLDAAREWMVTEAGATFIHEARRIEKAVEFETRPSLERRVAHMKSTEIAMQSGSYPRLLRLYLTDPELWFDEAPRLLCYLWNIFYKDPSDQVRTFIVNVQLGILLQKAIGKAVSNDDVVLGLVEHTYGNQLVKSRGVARILGAYEKAGRPLWPGWVASHERDDTSKDVAHFYLTDELRKVAGLSCNELLVGAFQGNIASRHGYRCDVKNAVAKLGRRRKRMRRADEYSDSLDTTDPAEWNPCDSSALSDLQGLDYREIGETLERSSDAIKVLLGPKGPGVLQAYLRDPEITQPEIAAELGCHLSTVQRVIHAIRDHEHALRRLLGVRRRR